MLARPLAEFVNESGVKIIVFPAPGASLTATGGMQADRISMTSSKVSAFT